MPVETLEPETNVPVLDLAKQCEMILDFLEARPEFLTMIEASLVDCDESEEVPFED